MIRLMADSTCDLTPDMIHALKVAILPLYIEMDDVSGRDGVDITPADIFRWAEEMHSTPKTAAFSPKDVEPYLKEACECGDEVIFIGISEALSSACSNVRLMASILDCEDRVYVVDSRSLSNGSGILVLAAAKMIGEGLSASEITEKLEKMKTRVHASFVVDTVEYLARGGRCSMLTGHVADVLNLHPKLIMRGGEIHVEKTFRGKCERIMHKYVKELGRQMKEADPELVFINQAGCSEELVALLKKEVEGLHYFNNILMTEAGGVISSHCGPGTVGIFFLEKEA